MSIYNYYLNQLKTNKNPDFIYKYLSLPSIERLKYIGYFCGMDYASNDIYPFSEYISRYDHSLTTALLTWKLTNDKNTTLAALFHDVATPCFSHVIDYLEGDFKTQETTENNTSKILLEDKLLNNYLKEDKIPIEDLINFKNFSIVDLPRPMLCADRIDGIILSSSIWTKTLKKEEIKQIIENLSVYKNENNQDEIGLKSKKYAEDLVFLEDTINNFCHSKEDSFMMLLLSEIVRSALNSEIITYNDLYQKKEYELLTILKSSNNKEILDNIEIFENITKNEIPDIEIPPIKVRKIKPIANGIRIKTSQN